MQLLVHISCWIQNFLMHWWDHSRWVVTGYSLPLTNRQGGSTSGNIKILVFFYCNECQRWWRTSTYLSSYCYVWMARPKRQWWKMGVLTLVPSLDNLHVPNDLGKILLIGVLSLRLTNTIIIILIIIIINNVYLINWQLFRERYHESVWACVLSNFD